MKLLLLSAMLPLLALAGCADKQPAKTPTYFNKGQEETSECFNYRQMMTAPIAPSALENLRGKCRESRGNN